MIAETRTEFLQARGAALARVCFALSGLCYFVNGGVEFFVHSFAYASALLWAASLLHLAVYWGAGRRPLWCVTAATLTPWCINHALLALMMAQQRPPLVGAVSVLLVSAFFIACNANPPRHAWPLFACMAVADNVHLSQAMGPSFLVVLNIVLAMALGARWMFLSFLTVQFDNRQLSFAAEAASRAKGRFLASMSHEVRTPLHAVMGALELLLKTPMEPAQQDYARTALRGARTLLTMVNGVLDYSKLESGQVRLVYAPMALPAFLLALGDEYAPLATAKGIAFQVICDEQLPARISCDAMRLRQILANLLNNAIKFTDRGGVELRAALEQGAEARLRFAVKDSGIGMTPAQQEQAFLAFRQGDETISQRYGGSGLGLNIARELTEALGGVLLCDSVPGEGSTFRCVLPLLRVATEAAAEARLLRVLVADDNAVNRMLARRTLEEAGHTVTAVDDGRQAVDAVRASPFDVILMDLQMPNMNGQAATAAIRLLDADRHAHTRIIALTAQVEATAEDLAGMDAFLAKPFARDELLALVSRRS